MILDVDVNKQERTGQEEGRRHNQLELRTKVFEIKYVVCACVCVV
jgi:hypothetical protein